MNSHAFFDRASRSTIFRGNQANHVPVSLFAQCTTDGAIGGLVSDQTKGVLPGATVTVKNVATTAWRPRRPMPAAISPSSRLQPGT